MSFRLPTLPSEQTEINRDFDLLGKKEHLLPIKVSGFYKAKIYEEVNVLGHTEGPLHRTVYPSLERLTERSHGEVPDFVEDRENMPERLRKSIIRKYHERMLFLPTSKCLSNCQYCFRQDVLSEQQDEQTTFDEIIEHLIMYLSENKEIFEVILSGGDPMALSFTRLKKILETLRRETKIESIRIHTRALTFSPDVFTDEKMRLFSEHNVRLVAHIVHPYEICDTVKRCIEALQQHHIRLYNQFPLLRKINDHSLVLIKLLKLLDELAIRNLSVFIPEPVNYSATFRIRLQRVFEIMDEVNWNTPAWINSTRFVLDSGYGKVRREDIKSYDSDKQVAVFERQGRQIRYPDLPLQMDQPGEISNLLWKGQE